MTHSAVAEWVIHHCVWFGWIGAARGELPFCGCVFADRVGICGGGGKTNTTCKSDKSHTCTGNWYDGLQWAGCVGTCTDETEQKTTSILEE